MKLNGNTAIAGLMIPNVLLLVIFLFIGFVFFRVGKTFSQLWARITNLIGLGTDERNLQGNDVAKELQNDPKVKTLMNVRFKTLADDLFKAMDYLGTDTKTIVDVFNRINTKDELKALYACYGIRSIRTFGFPSNGNLVDHLKEECSFSFLNQKRTTNNGPEWTIQGKLDWRLQ